MTLRPVDLPNPSVLRGGWAALAAVLAARGWANDVYTNGDDWIYHDGGGNWAAVRHKGEGRAILCGHDHEYSQTYYGDAAEYFGEPETDLLAGAPEWWAVGTPGPSRVGEWVGFIYGWDGQRWQRADYDLDDGFKSVGLVKACTQTESIAAFAEEAPGLAGGPPDHGAIQALIDADADVTNDLVQAVVPGWDVAAGVAAARAFLR